MKALVRMIFISIFCFGAVYAQSPQAFKYQAVARDSSGNIMANQAVAFRISLHKSSATGAIVYSERQVTTTNMFGLANLNIGQGALLQGNFQATEWGSYNYFVEIEFDPAGGTSYVSMGTSQLLSVPYALFSAKSSDNYWQKTSNTLFPTVPGDHIYLSSQSLNGAITGRYNDSLIGSLGNYYSGVAGTNTSHQYGGAGVLGNSGAEYPGTTGVKGYNSAYLDGNSVTLAGSLNGTVGFVFNGYPNHYGVFGTRYDDNFGPSGGVLGSVDQADQSKPWGALGFKDIYLSDWGGYFHGPAKAYLTSTFYAAITGDGGPNWGNGGYFSAQGTDKYGVFSQNFHASGTGVVGTGNGLGWTTMGNGSGGAFTGTITGLYAYAYNDYGDRQAAYLQEAGGNYAAVCYTSPAGTEYKILGPGSVSTVVDKPGKGEVNMFCPESPEIQLTDNGTGSLVNGRCHITLDPIFANNIVINETYPLKAFIQLEGDCMGVYVTNKTSDGFDVIELQGGKSDVPFSWSVIANRADKKDSDGKLLSKNLGIRFPDTAPRLEKITGKPVIIK